MALPAFIKSKIINNINPLMSCGNKTSYVLKQTCSFQLKVCLSTYDLFLPPDIKGLIRKSDSLLCEENFPSTNDFNSFLANVCFL